MSTFKKSRCLTSQDLLGEREVPKYLSASREHEKFRSAEARQVTGPYEALDTHFKAAVEGTMCGTATPQHKNEVQSAEN